ncbi:MAG TPA: hypothetical protein VFK37_05975 [Bacillales bacterium]|nr:hypothetical protein [Bacillales bacterium]
MTKLQGILTVCLFILLGMIIYSYWSGNELGIWMKGWLTVCAILYFARLYEKYRKNPKE